MNQLYFGDNLHVMRENVKDESVHLIYLDPPFNSQRDYNVLFKSPKGQQSEAQITAFLDSWHWVEQAEFEFDELLHQSNTAVAEMMEALRGFLGENDMMAYLTMMGIRLLEMHRALTPTGSLYLHCDPTASHFLRLVLDAVFEPGRFRNEITWKRSSAHSGAKRWGPIHDTILFYTKSDRYCWNPIFQSYDEEYVERFYKFEDGKGRYQVDNLTGAGKRGGDSGEPWRGVNPTDKGRHWAVPGALLREFVADSSGMTSQEKLDALDAAGMVYWPPKGGMPRLKRYLRSDSGVAIQDVVTDINPISAHAAERLGYPTQKPLALLERIVSASSNSGDVILDPFCGCGTAVHAAQKLNRQWIGIDITHLAIALIEKRLKDAFGKDCPFEVHGTPKDLAAARDLAARNKYQFQWWAVSLVDAQPYQGKKKGADSGIDGIKFFHDLEGEAKKIVVSVKGGAALKPDDIRALNHVREREKADFALLISLAEPTAKMRADAASAGIYTGGAGQKCARVQLLTIEGLLSGSQRAEHPDYVPNVNYKKAKREKRHQTKELFEDHD